MTPHHPAYTSPATLTPLLFVAALLAFYLIAATRLRTTRRRWSPWRAAAFVAGTILLAVSLSPPLAAYAHDDLRGDMLQHLLIGMFAPLGLAHCAPDMLTFQGAPRLIARINTSTSKSGRSTKKALSRWVR